LHLGYDAAGVDTRDAVAMMVGMANAYLADSDWKFKIIDDLMTPKPPKLLSPKPAVSSLKSPLAIRQVHPDVRWG
jgi:hypothetical protein